MKELTTTEIAVLAHKSERQVQRWIKDGKLPAQHIRGNVYSVNESDIAALVPGQVSTLDIERVEALERRVNELERKVNELMASAAPMKILRPARAEYHTSTAQPGEGLPDNLVSFTAFADLHGMARSTVVKAIQTGRLASISGEWHVGRAIIKHALDQSGRAAFYTLYRDNPHFQACQDCPHE